MKDINDLTTVITKLQQSAKQTVEERSKAEALFASIGDGAIVTNDKGRIVKVNKAALNMLGFTKKELTGKSFPRIIVALNEDETPINPLDRPIARVFLGGATVNQKAIYIQKNGDQLPVDITVSPIMYEGKPIGAIEVFRDISRENKIDRMKSEFVSIASHQLRTPLSMIFTYANMLADGFQGKLSKGQRQYMDVILEASSRMNELISTLLDVSRIEAGSLRPSPEEISIQPLLSNTVNEVKQTSRAKKIKLGLSVSNSLPAIVSDPLLLGEIYINLISNAIKYTPPGGQININVEVIKNELVFSVSDNGYGIPRALQDRIFSKFFRADNAIKQETSGTGLGLYLSKQIAEVLGGRIWFKSRENIGSTFYFALPLDQ